MDKEKKRKGKRNRERSWRGAKDLIDRQERWIPHLTTQMITNPQRVRFRVSDEAKRECAILIAHDDFSSSDLGSFISAREVSDGREFDLYRLGANV
jgi:hypothetical protein